MRSTIEQTSIYDSRLVTPRIASLTFRMAGTLILNNKSPSILVLDLNGTDRDVYLTALTEERQYTIANVGSSGNLTVRDSGGTSLVIIPPGYIYVFFATATRWVWMGSFSGSGDPTGTTELLRVVTAAGTVTISATEAGVVLNKAVASATPVSLPSVTVRNGKPVRVYDFANNVDLTNPITFTPSGAETIQGQSTWEVSQGGAMLIPHTGLNGWLVV